MTVTGWLFDAYPVGPRMVFWIKTADGSMVRVTDDWSHSIYVGCDDTQEAQDFQLLKISRIPFYILYVSDEGHFVF